MLLMGLVAVYMSKFHLVYIILKMSNSIFLFYEPHLSSLNLAVSYRNAIPRFSTFL